MCFIQKRPRAHCNTPPQKEKEQSQADLEIGFGFLIFFLNEDKLYAENG